MSSHSRARRKIPADVRLGRSGVHGYGLFARDFIPQGARIIEYLGERITKVESRRREAQQLAKRAAGGAGCFYIFELNQRHDLDGSMTWNAARRINHSCAPNCESQNLRGHIWIVALRDLVPGEELTFDYGFGYADWREHPCCCGASVCVGYIVNAAQRWRVRRILRQAG
ncbi:MAG: SET domain-containing protein-lysine N-methyltransferase [Opitutaceae bacterium]